MLIKLLAYLNYELIMRYKVVLLFKIFFDIKILRAMLREIYFNKIKLNKFKLAECRVANIGFRDSSKAACSWKSFSRKIL